VTLREKPKRTSFRLATEAYRRSPLLPRDGWLITTVLVWGLPRAVVPSAETSRPLSFKDTVPKVGIVIHIGFLYRCRSLPSYVTPETRFTTDLRLESTFCATDARLGINAAATEFIG
jgi:hypothetical protein